MGRAVFILLALVPATAAYANPCISPTSIAATIVVVMAALGLEVFITSGVLLFCGMAPIPTFFALLLGNVASYLGVLAPLAYYFETHVILAEIAVVTAETVFIKLVSVLPLLQQDSFTGLKWRSALLAVLLGNASSYYIGTLMT